MYNFKFTLEDKDYIEFNKFYLFKHSKRGKRDVLTVRICAFVIFASASVFFLNRNLVLFALFLAGAVVVALLSKWFYAKQIEKQIAKIKKEGKLPYGQKVELSFREADFYHVSEQGESTVPYNALEAVVCGDDGSVYLFNSAMSAVIVPARAFENPQQAQEFMDFVNR
ncbi:MAG: YcxB family protein [Defluviitaleaceae bacterium]|nr:YcxB family protein [Defluviitaleaceae bacterium]